MIDYRKMYYRQLEQTVVLTKQVRGLEEQLDKTREQLVAAENTQETLFVDREREDDYR